MKVSKWNTVRLSFVLDVQMGSPCGRKHDLSFWLADEQWPWANTTSLSVQSRTGSGGTVYLLIHADPSVAAEFRKFVGNTRSTPADAQHLIGMIASLATPREELSEAQREVWEGFVEAVKYGYSIEIGGAA
jgi:hypothetical protein